MLETQDVRLIFVILEAVDNILFVGDQLSKQNGSKNPYLQIMEEAETIEKLEDLQNHQNKEIYEKAVRILEVYFGAEQENISENIFSQVIQQQQQQQQQPQQQQLQPQFQNTGFAFSNNFKTPGGFAF